MRGPNAQVWEAAYSDHATLLEAFWKSIGFEPGPFMTVGMEPKRAAWLARVLDCLGACG
jgi:hypothetical protein